MKKGRIIVLALAALALFMTACGGGKLSPEKVVTNCWQMLSQGDVAGAVELFALTNETEHNSYVALYSQQAERLIAVGGVAEVEILSVSCGEQEASVEAKVIFANGTEDTSLYKLINTSEGWRLAK